MKTRKRILMIVIVIVMVLLLPTVVVQAQDDDPPPSEGDETVDALVMAAVNHNMFEGDTENSDLRELGKIVDIYYAVRIQNVEEKGGDNAAAVSKFLHDQRDDLVRRLERKIQGNKEARKWAIKFFDLLFGGGEEPKKKIEPAVPPLSIVSGDEDRDYIREEREESKFMANFENHVYALTNINLVFSSPDMAPKITDSTAWTYTPPPAISNSAPPVSAPAAEVAPPLAPISAPSVQEPTEGNNETFLKPIGFNNTGFDAVTVVVESYTPAEGYSPAVSTASTVVTPGGNSSGYLNLPLGTYTFCYYWELDGDFNNDGNIDYHHKVSGPATLNVNSSDSPESAIRVTLNPDSNISNPNGKCGENMTGSASNLTPEEAANEGRRTYLGTCTGTVVIDPCDTDPTETVTVDVSFSSGAVTIDHAGEKITYPRIGVNQYVLTDGGSTYTLVFTTSGFTIRFQDSEWGSDAVFTYTRQ